MNNPNTVQESDTGSTWREATREEINTYYQTEFPEYIDQLPDFITPTGPKGYALSFGDIRFPVIDDAVDTRDFIRRKTRYEGKDRPTFPSFEALLKFIQYPAHHDPLREAGIDKALADPDVVTDTPSPIPHAVYYRLDHWKRNWVLVFDIDAKDIAFDEAREQLHGAGLSREQALEKTGITSAPPAGYPYKFEHIRRALEYGFELEAELKSTFEFRETMVVYSGQGCHIYGLDNDAEHRYDSRSREVMNFYLEKQLGIPIDPVVTPDRARVMRLPYSLHADVSRIVTPIDSPDFDFRQATTPKFL
jgi:hypothetical protein